MLRRPEESSTRYVHPLRLFPSCSYHSSRVRASARSAEARRSEQLDCREAGGLCRGNVAIVARGFYARSNVITFDETTFAHLRKWWQLERRVPSSVKGSCWSGSRSPKPSI